MKDSQLRDSISTTAPQRATTSETLCEDFERQQAE